MLFVTVFYILKLNGNIFNNIQIANEIPFICSELK